MIFATKIKQFYSTLEESNTAPASEITDIVFIRHGIDDTVIYKFVFADGTEKFFEVQVSLDLVINYMEEVELVELG